MWVYQKVVHGGMQAFSLQTSVMKIMIETCPSYGSPNTMTRERRASVPLIRVLSRSDSAGYSFKPTGFINVRTNLRRNTSEREQ